MLGLIEKLLLIVILNALSIGVGAEFSFAIVSPAPTITSVTPSSGNNDLTTTIIITGTNFQTTGTTRVTLDVTIAGTLKTILCSNVNVSSATQISASVPADKQAYLYNVKVTNPDGRHTTKSGAFTVSNPPRASMTLPSWWYTLDVEPLEAGSPASASNASFEVNLASDKYVMFDDFPTSSLWAHVKDLGGSDNSFKFTLTSAVPAGWQAPGASSPQMLPGSEGDVKFILPKSISSVKQEGVFTYEVSSDAYVGQTLNLTFTLAWLPQVSSSGSQAGNATVEGTITDASTGSPISDAEVTLWLGLSTRLMPYDTVKETDSSGFYRLSCWGIDVLNNYYAPYLTVPGYVAMVQKKGYETYVHTKFVIPQYGSPITLNASLTPLANQVSFELKWGTALSSPGVWGIAVTDTWERFAVAMGKHPDDGDPENLPTSIPFLNNQGAILWSKPLDDQSWAIDVTSDGSHVACATHASGTVQNACYVWNSSGTEVWKKNSTSQSTTITFSPNNQYIATGPSETGKSFVLYNTLTGIEEWTYDTGLSRVRQTAFTAHGQYVIFGAPFHLNKVDGTSEWRRNEDTGPPYIICPSTDNSRIFIPDKGGCASMFDGSGNLLWRKEHRVLTYGGMSADASVVVVLSHNGNLYCYNKTGELQWYRLIPGGGGSGHDGLDITPDGKYIAIGGGNYNTILYDSKGNVLWCHTGSATINTSEHPYWHSVMNVRISPDGRKIASGYGYSDPRLCYFTRVATPCQGCPDDVVVLKNVTFSAGTTCECVGTQSITVGPGVIVQKDANVTFAAPAVTLESGFLAEEGSVVNIKRLIAPMRK